ncbi:MAG: purine-nucleoside phosphorylase [Planctomycetota bacterium]
MSARDTHQQRVSRAAEWVTRRLKGAAPRTGLILGTGLGALVGEIEDGVRIPYEEIPGFPISTSPGHSGTLHHGRIADRPVLVFEGRFHLYEGYSMQEITLPVRLMGRLGVKEMIISNACGSMIRDHRKGDLLIIEDHINLLGGNPLIGFNIDDWGPRFPDMSAPYDPEMVRRLKEIADGEGIGAHLGVYVAVPGPSLETRAEYRMLRGMGADVVGMSTVPEVIVGVHEGIRVAGISIITDLCFPDDLEPISLPEILQVAAVAEPKLTRIVVRLLEGTP